jgi:hypothetical protein
VSTELMPSYRNSSSPSSRHNQFDGSSAYLSFQVNHLLPIGRFFVRRFDRQSYEVIFDFENRNENVITDDDCFVFATGNDLHR